MYLSRNSNFRWKISTGGQKTKGRKKRNGSRVQGDAPKCWSHTEAKRKEQDKELTVAQGSGDIMFRSVIYNYLPRQAAALICL